VQREQSAGRVAEDCRCSAGFADQRLKILDLALDGVRSRVATVAAPAAVVDEDREVRRQGRGQWLARRPSVERAHQHDEWLALSEPLECDRGAVFR
jgi:hypothetical protein